MRSLAPLAWAVRSTCSDDCAWRPATVPLHASVCSGRRDSWMQPMETGTPSPNRPGSGSPGLVAELVAAQPGAIGRGPGSIVFVEADYDRAMLLGYGHPMVPLRLTDLVGLRHARSPIICARNSTI